MSNRKEGAFSMVSLPYWDHNVNFNVVSWYPFGLDYRPFSVNEYHSPCLRSIASLSPELDSEFFCLTSFQSGYVGTLLRDSMIVPRSEVILELGFTMVFGYSRKMETLLSALVGGEDGLRGGVTKCYLWNDSILVQNFKSIILICDDPLFDENGLLDRIETSMKACTNASSVLPFYAERFGYTRFFIPFETDNLTDLRISKYLNEMELESTRKITGPSPEEDLPGIDGIAVRDEK